MATDAASMSAFTSVLVGLLAAGLALLALRARGRRGNRDLTFVAAAFGLFLVKSLFSAYNVLTHAVPHDAIELVLSLFDLAVLALIALPLLVRTPP